ncbi:antA/AntB antirepressor family protein [Corynebacterium accolens]|uniref:antA/AntB antirepressor family protein n=1 Tax=Corynebacterium accolens TaxID=38284 RepID=UPI00266F0390|nr:antA/AntB antirepressor family protein [Corynebacterium accolens]WKS68990.1 antA/AntB antirepressor family protein [Corynebacterium accolens]WKS72144.1 antA/AntB antirepressor family protein [Corynebacterium accolens]WKS74467.1 antA/AntB antirepressor family protein [Corynebacterium accolens]
MSELIPIQDNDGAQAVMGRDLHAFLEVRDNYTDWMKRMVAYGFSAGQDFSEISDKPKGAGRPRTDHIVTLDMAKEISMIQRTEKGKQARQYFIECERRAKETAELSPEEIMARAIKVADHTIKELEAKTADQALALEAAKPKVEYYDHCVSIESDVMTVKDWGAHFGLTEPQARQKLLDAKMIYRKTQTREWSSRKGDVVDRNEYRAYAAYRNLFDIRAQHNAPRYHNGQVRQTLYVRAGWAITVAKNAGIQVDQSIYDALPGSV